MYRITNAEELGTLIRQERKRKGYSQTKLAHYAGVGINYISNLENGKDTAELGKAIRVLNTLGVDLFAENRGDL